MLAIKQLTKKFAGFELKPLSLEIASGDYFVMLGPSGSGKTLILELLCGFQQADKGEILLHGKPIQNVSINKRNIGMVFQKPLLFPHYTVAENIGFSMRFQDLETPKRKQKINALAEDFQISHLLKRKPSALSGGEAQRVMLARAIAMNPEILLLDEPLSSLDVLLRSDMRRMLKSLNNRGLTIFHVTHDFEEALRMAKTIGIMQSGSLLQSGTPEEVLRKPTSAFAAELSGLKNYFRARLDSIVSGNLRKASVENQFVMLNSSSNADSGAILIDENQIVISLEKPISSAQNQFKGLISNIQNLANGCEIEVDAGLTLIAKITNASLQNLKLKTGKEVYLSFKASAVSFIHD